MNSLFRINEPTEANVKSFHEDGYIFFPDILKDGPREQLINEAIQNNASNEVIDRLQNFFPYIDSF